MSAAAARRRKQLASKNAAQTNATDPITSQLNALLSPETVDESTAYEALQLAQSQLRKSIKSSEYEKATVAYGYEISLLLLEKHGKASISSQLLTLLAQALLETHTACDGVWIKRVEKLHCAYLKAVDKSCPKGGVEKRRLLRVHSKFLKKILTWSDSLGTVRFGALEIHEVIGHHFWNLAVFEEEHPHLQPQHKSGQKEDGDDEDDDIISVLSLKSDAVQHLALAEKPEAILAYLQPLPGPTATETTANHPSPPCLREALLTRSILVMVAVENLRDSYTLLTSYLSSFHPENNGSDMQKLKKSYTSKTDGKAPSHVIFLSMLLSMCIKDKKTGPLYNWLLKGFQGEIGRMHKPEVLRSYTMKIGRVYFDIIPPPSMMNSLENMMAMMGGGGMGGGGPAGGLNPAMMQAMMGGAGGAGGAGGGF